MNTLVYTTPNCPQCHATKRKLTELEIDYSEVDLSTNPNIADAMRRAGLTHAPIVIAPHRDPIIGYSPDKLQDLAYRYTLDRYINDSDTRVMVFIMLNPSTADDDRDDPTIRRCIGFARREGAGQLHVVNLYARRATDPKTLHKYTDPTGGTQNDLYIRRAAFLAADTGGWLIAAWGANARIERVRKVMKMIAPIMPVTAFGFTKRGAPRHPLYLPANAELCTQWMG